MDILKDYFNWFILLTVDIIFLNYMNNYFVVLVEDVITICCLRIIR